MAQYQGNRLGAQDRPSLFLTIPFGRTVITLETSPVTHGPRASSVQENSIIAACARGRYIRRVQYLFVFPTCTCIFFVFFLEQLIAGRSFYSNSKENASALNFAVQVDDKFTAYSTFLFFPLVNVFCVFC